MSTIGYLLSNNIELSLVAAIQTLLTGAGYVWGAADGEINIVEDWLEVDFTLPCISMNVARNSEEILSLGIDVNKKYVLTMYIFARSGLERKQLADYIADYFENTDSVLLSDYNNDPITNDGWIHFNNISWSPQVIEREKDDEDREDLTVNVAVLTADIEVKKDI